MEEKVTNEPDGGVKKYIVGLNNWVKVENIDLGILIIVILFDRYRSAMIYNN